MVEFSDLTGMKGQGSNRVSDATAEILAKEGQQQQREFPKVAGVGDKVAAFDDGGFRGDPEKLGPICSAIENASCAAMLIAFSQQRVEARLSSVQAV